MRGLAALRRLSAALLAWAWVAPAFAAGMPLLTDNGRCFIAAGRRPDFACLDEPGLLERKPAACDAILKAAAAQGFSAVSFDAPLLGKAAAARRSAGLAGPPTRALRRVLGACRKFGLYAFPVLYPPSAVDALIGTQTARAVFFGGRRSWGWQRWALGRLASLKVGGRPLGRCPEVGGFLLYRGAWPGGIPGATTPTSASAKADAAWFRAWVSATVVAARRDGLRQELGIGLVLGEDLGQDPAAPPDAPDGGAPGSGGPPLAPLDPHATAVPSSDALPPVPGSPGGGIDDSGILPPAPDSGMPGAPHGGALATFLAAFPRATQVDFLEVTLDSEDWYGAGAFLARAAREAGVPVLWRQDWRDVPDYERGRRLRAPLPLAGLCGPWPHDDWTPGLWRYDPRDPREHPLRVRSVRLRRARGLVVLDVDTGGPARIVARWGRHLPFRHRVRVPEGPGSGAPLGRMAPGTWFLLRLTADEPGYFGAVWRTRWMKAP